MKEKNILIIGNGYDLALKRQTSYEDFIRFSSQITGFPLDDEDYLSICRLFSFAVTLSTFNDAFKSNVDVLVEELITNIIKKHSEKYLELTFKDLSFIYNYRNILFQDVMFIGKNKALEKYSMIFDDNIEYPVTSEFITFIQKTFATIEKDYKKHEIDLDLLIEIIETSCFYINNNSEIEEKDLECDYAIIKTISKFFDQFSENKILKFILINKPHLTHWSNLERQISELANAILVLKNNLDRIDINIFYKNNIDANFSDILKKSKENFSTFPNSLYVSFIIDEIATTDYPKEMSVISILDSYNQDLISSLNSLTYLLEFYLAYLDRKEKNIGNEDIIDLINVFGEIKNVLSFNYTNTAQLLYGLEDNAVHYIHGKQNFINSTVEKNNLVFGIEDNDIGVNNDLIDYQKTFQRVVKKTGFLYRSFIELKELNKFEICRFIVFGHSLDVLDKEIFLDFFEKIKLEKLKCHIEIFVLYYGDMDLKDKVRNLSMYLGKDKLIELSADDIIHFIDTQQIEECKAEIQYELRKSRESILKNIQKSNQKINY